MLSIIIVNYNVKYFLEQCLCSVRDALKQVEGEVIVVDNASTDGSREYLEPRFPEVRFIWNTSNVGFARANNQALAMAKGELVLFLNPDTIVAEDSFRICSSFMELHPDAGAMGVRMIDGSGTFLKESKRAYPSLATSFFKLSGLSSLFPSSGIFGRYHLGHLDPLRDHEVDVLAGAYLLARREVLERTGGFDEAFFMYGEDIDLSYRIQKLGYKNYYCAGTTIIHFKGESTKRGTLNYVRMFYKAMIIFVRKHYSSITARLFLLLLNLAIWARAGVAALAGFVRNNGLPIVDAINTMFSFGLAGWVWSRYVKPEIDYRNEQLVIAFPVFALVFVVVAYYAGLYDKHQRKGRVIHSTIFSVVILLALYSLLPETYRFSRGMLLLGSLLAFLLISASRWMLRKWGWIEEERDEQLATVIVGNMDEYDEAMKLMQRAEKEDRVLGRIAPVSDGHPHLATLYYMKDVSSNLPLREVIFCQGVLGFGEIIRHTGNMQAGWRMRIHSSGSGAIVGSDSSTSLGQVMGNEQQFVLDLPYSRRFKRLLDVLTSITVIVLFPLNIFFIRKPFHAIANALRVLTGSVTWVGYSTRGEGLPSIAPGIIGTNGLPCRQQVNEEGLQMLDQLYAREYHVYRDLYLITKGYKWLGT